MQTRNSHTPHIKKFFERLEKLKAEARREVGGEVFSQIEDDFDSYADQRFITEYCNEQLKRYSKYIFKPGH